MECHQEVRGSNPRFAANYPKAYEAAGQKNRPTRKQVSLRGAMTLGVWVLALVDAISLPQSKSPHPVGVEALVPQGVPRSRRVVTM